MHMTANKLHNIIKVVIFVLDNLYELNKEKQVNNAQLYNVFYKFL